MLCRLEDKVRPARPQTKRTIRLNVWLASKGDKGSQHDQLGLIRSSDFNSKHLLIALLTHLLEVVKMLLVNFLKDALFDAFASVLFVCTDKFHVQEVSYSGPYLSIDMNVGLFVQFRRDVATEIDVAEREAEFTLTFKQTTMHLGYIETLLSDVVGFFKLGDPLLELLDAQNFLLMGLSLVI